MGLDMYLYKFEKSSRGDNFIVNENDINYESNEIFIDEETYSHFPSYIQKNFVKGTLHSRYLDMLKIMGVVFETDCKEWGYSLGGQRWTSASSIYTYYLTPPSGTKITINTNPVVEDTDELIIKFSCKKSNFNNEYIVEISVSEKYESGMNDYKGEYLIEENSVSYNACRYEAEYQRKGLDDIGFSLLPENCEYCFDKKIVEDLIEHGLSLDFLRSWEEGSTAFYAWW